MSIRAFYIEDRVTARDLARYGGERLLPDQTRLAARKIAQAVVDHAVMRRVKHIITKEEEGRHWTQGDLRVTHLCGFETDPAALITLDSQLEAARRQGYLEAAQMLVEQAEVYEGAPRFNAADQIAATCLRSAAEKIKAHAPSGVDRGFVFIGSEIPL